ncbi:hypothetical protein F4776DRAFT_629525 [Hypoxylon sp. NC0597]|nr:hypothetical protein F4776DRAFT_629525 [Hypoxylon sp. NC0597]
MSWRDENSAVAVEKDPILLHAKDSVSQAFPPLAIYFRIRANADALGLKQISLLSPRRRHRPSVGSGLVTIRYSITLLLAQYYELDTPRLFPRSNSSMG